MTNGTNTKIIDDLKKDLAFLVERCMETEALMVALKDAVLSGRRINTADVNRVLIVDHAFNVLNKYDSADFIVAMKSMDADLHTGAIKEFRLSLEQTMDRLYSACFSVRLLVEPKYQQRVYDLIDEFLEGYTAFLNTDVVRTYLPKERRKMWSQLEDKVANLFEQGGKFLHDVAVIFTTVLERLEGVDEQTATFTPTELLQRASESYDSGFNTGYIGGSADDDFGEGARASLYLSGSILNIQARTGHSVKVDLGNNKIWGHLGDSEYLPERYREYSDLAMHVPFWRMSLDDAVTVVNALGRIIHYEQILREVAPTGLDGLALELQELEETSVEYNKLEEELKELKRQLRSKGVDRTKIEERIKEIQDRIEELKYKGVLEVEETMVDYTYALDYNALMEEEFERLFSVLNKYKVQ